MKKQSINAVQNIIKQANQKTQDDLWDTKLLDETKLKFTKNKVKSAREVTDKEFLTWLTAQIDKVDIQSRLRWRTFCLVSLDWLKSLKDSHFERKA